MNITAIRFGTFKYASPSWVEQVCDPAVVKLFWLMSEGLDFLSWTYIFKKLEAGEKFGHGKFHTDGLGKNTETHRLLTFGWSPTLGKNGQVLYAGTIWEFPGDFVHKAQPCSEACNRLLLRVSSSKEIKHRNFWQNER